MMKNFLENLSSMILLLKAHSMIEKKIFNNKGITLMELMIGLGLTGAVGLIVFGVMKYSDKELKIATDDIQTLILKFGANKVLQRDLTNARPTFNYMNTSDDNGKPFFVYAQNQYCKSNCSRKLTLSIKTGHSLSEPIFFLVVRGAPSEKLKFNFDPLKTFDETSKEYKYINIHKDDPNLTMSKDKRPESPWAAERLLLLTSEVSFYDCLNPVHGGTTSSCTIECSNGSGNCNYTSKRPYQMLGVVKNDESELEYFDVSNRPDLFKTNFKLCRVDKANTCASVSDVDLKKTKDFFEKLSYMPGYDNSVYLEPIEFVRYHLEKPTANSKDKEIVLMRSIATLSGSKLSFTKAHVLLTGIKSIEFSRKNISNPVLEFKIIKSGQN